MSAPSRVTRWRDRCRVRCALAFIFANPLYFVLILTADLRGRMVPLALALGAVAGPLVHLVLPAWSVIFGGSAGGTAAFFLTRDRHD
ncbi:MAG: hypothetical protein IPM02_11795 [Betaproteobacteria bacterium]|nr:hypothetical protein [Betaproteobacteria bacterium]